MNIRKSLYSALAAAALVTPALMANAADLPRARPAPAVVPYVAPVYNWTGFYIGGNIGGAWADIDVTRNLGGTWSTSSSAFIGGVQAGYNWQFGGFVLGIEGDWDWTDASRSTGFVTLPNCVACAPVQARGDWDWTATLAGRFGFAADRVLFYGKLGAGWSKTSATLQNAGGAVLASSSNTNFGWLVGAGVEWAFAQNWSVKLEYNYLALDDRTFLVPAGAVLAGGSVVTVDPSIQMLKAGINYKFF
jgi:outer membrane immunogenic protein